MVTMEGWLVPGVSHPPWRGVEAWWRVSQATPATPPCCFCLEAPPSELRQHSTWSRIMFWVLWGHNFFHFQDMKRYLHHLMQMWVRKFARVPFAFTQRKANEKCPAICGCATVQRDVVFLQGWWTVCYHRHRQGWSACDKRWDRDRKTRCANFRAQFAPVWLTPTFETIWKDLSVFCSVAWAQTFADEDWLGMCGKKLWKKNRKKERKKKHRGQMASKQLPGKLSLLWWDIFECLRTRAWSSLASHVGRTEKERCFFPFSVSGWCSWNGNEAEIPRCLWDGHRTSQ